MTIQKSNLDKTLFEMCYNLIDVESWELSGYTNCIDIHVDNDEHTFLLSNGIVSHNSALGGLMPVLGREDCAYYTLKGKPLNAYSSNQKKFTENKELSGLYQIIKNGASIDDKPDGDFFEITIGDQKIIANINDEVKIDNQWVPVKKLIKGDI